MVDPNMRATHRDVDTQLDLSVVLPCFNEQASVADLVAELDAVLEQLDLDSEIVIVDDASTDGSLRVLGALRAGYPRVRVGVHRLRSGQSAAFCSGWALARGRVLAMMDADGQADPADLPRLLERLESTDVVCGVRRDRNDRFVKALSSRIGNGFRKLVTRDPTTDAGCTFRVMRADVVRELPVFDGLHRWMPALLRMQGFDVVECGVRHRLRTGGVSKYGIRNRLGRGLLDCLAMLWWRRRALPARRAAECVALAPLAVAFVDAPVVAAASEAR